MTTMTTMTTTTAPRTAATTIEMFLMKPRSRRLANVATRHAHDWMLALVMAGATIATAALAVAAI